MTELERKNIMTYVENYRNALPEGLQTYWSNWIKNRDIIVNKLKLTEDQKLLLTKRSMAELVLAYIKQASGFNTIGPTKFKTTKGTTNVINKMASLVDEQVKIEKMIPKTVKRFDEEMEKLNKKSR